MIRAQQRRLARRARARLVQGAAFLVCAGWTLTCIWAAGQAVDLMRGTPISVLIAGRL